MWIKFKWFWFKGSAVAVLFITIALVLGGNISPITNTGYNFLDWVVTYIILLTPFGAIIGYFILWIFAFFLDLLLSLIGLERGTVTSYVTRVLQPQTTSKTYSSTTSCPFAGTIYANKENEILGFALPKSAKIFSINNQWEVSTPNNKKFGWIDGGGMIHKGKTLGGINPKETLSEGITGLKVSGNYLFKGSEKIGEIV